MSVESTPHVAEFWLTTMPCIPIRSRLHSLPPYGVGTPHVESFTSYVARLATTHQVPTGILLAQEVAPYMSKSTNCVHQRSSQRFFSIFFIDTGAWNGTGRMASQPMQILSFLTKQYSLRFLSLLTWASVLPTRGLLRSKKAWCPVCYSEWAQNSVVIHEPLLWSLQIVTVCPFHRQFLLHKCPYCQQTLYAMEWNSRPGYCSRCHQWLGSAQLNPDEQNSQPLLEDEYLWQAMVCKNLGEIFAEAPYLLCPPQRIYLAKAIDLCITTLTNGNAKAFADLFGISTSVPRDWRTGQSLPQVDLLLRICYSLDIPLKNFFLGSVKINQPVSLKQLPLGQQIRKTNRRFDSQYVQNFLEAVLKEAPPKSMRQVAASLGYHPGDLSKHFPDLCRAISTRYQSYRKSTKQRW